jgi:hypothetical protein
VKVRLDWGRDEQLGAACERHFQSTPPLRRGTVRGRGNIMQATPQSEELPRLEASQGGVIHRSKCPGCERIKSVLDLGGDPSLLMAHRISIIRLHERPCIGFTARDNVSRFLEGCRCPSRSQGTASWNAAASRIGLTKSQIRWRSGQAVSIQIAQRNNHGRSRIGLLPPRFPAYYRQSPIGRRVLTRSKDHQQS